MGARPARDSGAFKQNSREGMPTDKLYPVPDLIDVFVLRLAEVETLSGENVRLCFYTERHKLREIVLQVVMPAGAMADLIGIASARQVS
jgi:hypothetical protein